MDAGRSGRRPLSGLRDWVWAHEKALAVGGSWGLAALFAAVAVYKLLSSLGLV